jgi:hypothetical protein
MKPTPRWTALLVAAIVALAVTSTSFAALQGDPLKLGLSNTINIVTSIAGKASNSMFAVFNSDTAAGASAIQARNTGGGSALDLRVNAGKAPMLVNSSGKVLNLNADLLDNLDSSTFMGDTTFTVESAINAGTPLGDGTFVASISCPTGSVLLSGGPANVNPGSYMVESFPQLPIWKARINPQGLADNWNVVALCAQR